MALIEELVEEVLLRFPPSDPASLVRAALVCKQWCRIVADTGFRRRFRELHRTPPLLGVLCNSNEDEYGHVGFVPTSSCLPVSYRSDCALDARHGRVLFFDLSAFVSRRVWDPVMGNRSSWDICLRVWDPVTGELRKLPQPQVFNLFGWNAAVLCAAHGVCDHLDCHGGPFLVVVVYSDGAKMHVRIYSSETGSWSEAASAAQPPTDFRPLSQPSALSGSALHFLTLGNKRILKYELTTRNVSMMQLPSDFSVDCAVLTTGEDGELGVAGLKDSRLYLWSMETGPKGDVGWAQSGVIRLETLLPVDVTISYECVAFAYGVGVFFVGTIEGLFSVDLKSHKVKKICKEACRQYGVCSFIPYLSFYMPALRMASTGYAPNGGASSP